jgi:hypothetical protein
LVVNGAFVAQHVQLQRTFGSLRNSVSGETPQSAAHACEVGSTGTANRGDCAAEIFNFSPEMYLAQPPFMPSGGPASSKYDYITSLSPVL